MKTILASLLLCLALGAAGAQSFVNTNLWPPAVTANLPGYIQQPWGTDWITNWTKLSTAGWCIVDLVQAAPSNYTILGQTFSNTAPAHVAIIITNSVNDSSNIVSQWLAIPGFMPAVSNYYTLIHAYTGSSYTGAVVNTFNTLGWVFGESRTNSSFTLSNLNDAHWCYDYSSTLINAPGNLGGTTATFPWGLWWCLSTNGPIQ
jgi:hypothetical protein